MIKDQRGSIRPTTFGPGRFKNNVKKMKIKDNMLGLTMAALFVIRWLDGKKRELRVVTCITTHESGEVHTHVRVGGRGRY